MCLCVVHVCVQCACVCGWKLGDFGSALRLGDSRTLDRQVRKRVCLAFALLGARAPQTQQQDARAGWALASQA